MRYTVALRDHEDMDQIINTGLINYDHLHGNPSTSYGYPSNMIIENDVMVWWTPTNDPTHFTFEEWWELYTMFISQNIERRGG